MTKNIRLEDNTFPHLECTTSLYTRLGNFKELSYRDHSVTGFDLILNHTVLFVKMEVTLANVVRGSTRRHEHHDLIVPLLTLFIRFGPVHLLGVIRYDAIRESSTVCVRMISVGKSRAITGYRLLPAIRFIITDSIGITIVVPDTFL